MRKALDAVMKVVGYVIALLVFVAVAVITMQVVWRYVFHAPISWTEQTCRYLYVWTVTLAIPLAYYRGTMLAFDMFLNALPRIGKIIMQTLINVLSIGFCGYYGYWSVYLLSEGGWRVAQGVPIKMGYLYVAQPICCVLLVWVLVTQTIDIFKNAKKSTEVEVKEA